MSTLSFSLFPLKASDKKLNFCVLEEGRQFKLQTPFLK